jgi:hypothetical protein
MAFSICVISLISFKFKRTKPVQQSDIAEAPDLFEVSRSTRLTRSFKGEELDPLPTARPAGLTENPGYNVFMGNTRITTVLHRALDPIGSCLTPKAADKLLRLKLDKKTQARLDVLADKCTEGELSADERAEYESAVLTLELLTLLQVEARAFLATDKAS